MNKKIRKNGKKKKTRKKIKKREKEGGEKGKEGPNGYLPPEMGPKIDFYHPRWAQKLIFHMRTVKRNRNEIEAQKKSDFEHPTKKKKMKENERQ